MEHYTLHFDGSCGPKNPGGTAAYGFSLSRQGEVVASGHGVIGTGEGMTNNLAEFWALWQGLMAAYAQFEGTTGFLQVLGDSNLVIQMMNRHFKPKREKAYYVGYEKAAGVLSTLRRRGVTVSFDWVPREQNTQCDDLSKAHQKKKTA